MKKKSAEGEKSNPHRVVGNGTSTGNEPSYNPQDENLDFSPSMVHKNYCEVI